MSRLGRGFPNNALIHQTIQRVKPPAAFLAAGPGGSGSGSSVTFTDSVPTDTSCTLIWATTQGTTASPAVSASVGGTSATLVELFQGSFASPYYNYLSCFAVLSPPTGSQTITYTTSSASPLTSVDTAHYENVTIIGTPVTGTGAGNPSMSVSSTNPNYMYANAFNYHATANGNTFSSYSQSQRYVSAAGSGPRPLVIGDAQGNGGTLTFSAARSSTTYSWGGIIVPLIP